MTGDAPRRLTRAQQQAATRSRLLDAAAEVFAERGVQGASIDEVTQRAGFTRGAFYSNFDSKADVLVELCETRLQHFAEEALAAIDALPEQEQVTEAARLLVEQGPQPEIALLIELARLRDSTPEVAELLDGFLTRFVGLVEQVLREHDDQLGTPTDAERRAGAQALTAAALGITFLRHLESDPAVATDAAATLLTGTVHAAFPAMRQPNDNAEVIL